MNETSLKIVMHSSWSFEMNRIGFMVSLIYCNVNSFQHIFQDFFDNRLIFRFQQINCKKKSDFQPAEMMIFLSA